MKANDKNAPGADVTFLRRILLALVVATFGAMATGTIAGVIAIQSAETEHANSARH